MLGLALNFTAVLAFLTAGVDRPISPHAREAVRVISELRAIGLPDPEGLPPAKVPSLLRRLNQEIRELIVETLNDRSRYEMASGEEVIHQLRAAGWEEISDHKWNAYGEIVDIDFGYKLGYEPGILVATTQLWIPCGSSDPDAAVYVFQGRARQWKLVMAADADFDSIGSKRQSGIQSEISPPDNDGKWFVAVAHVPPSCRHAASDLRYKLMRPGRSPDEPETLLDRRDVVDPQFDPPFRIRVEEDWFALTRGKRRKLDGEWGISIARYEVKDKEIKRTHPLALSPEDFLDEWVQLSWEDAARWTGESKASTVQHWHALLSSLESDSTELRVVQPCQDHEGSEGAWMIGLWIDRQMNPTVKEENLYITISLRQGIYHVDDIQTARPSGCPGNTRLTPLTDWKLPSW